MRAKLLNILAACIIFIGSIVVISERYQEERVIAVESGLGVIPMTIISVVVLVSISYIAANFKALIYKNAFGSFSVLLYGVLLGVVVVLGYHWVGVIVNGAQVNLDMFIDNLQYHQETLRLVGGVVLLGISVILIDPALSLIKKRQP